MIGKLLVSFAGICGLVGLAATYLPLSSWGLNLGFNTVFGAVSAGITALALYLLFAEGTQQI